MLATLAEFNSVVGQLNTVPFQIWIGADDRQTESVCAWINGEPFSYTDGQPPWRSDEPNGDATENCVEIRNVGQDLNDIECTWANPYLCEYPPQ